MLSVPAEANIEAQQKHGQGLADLTQQEVSLLPLGHAETLNVHVGCGYTCTKRLAAWQHVGV